MKGPTPMFLSIGLRALDPTYSVQLGCVVGEMPRKGPDYTADGAIFKMEASGENDNEEEASEVADDEESADQVTILVQVHAPLVRGVDR